MIANYPSRRWLLMAINSINQVCMSFPIYLNISSHWLSETRKFHLIWEITIFRCAIGNRCSNLTAPVIRVSEKECFCHFYVIAAGVASNFLIYLHFSATFELHNELRQFRDQKQVPVRLVGASRDEIQRALLLCPTRLPRNIRSPVCQHHESVPGSEVSTLFLSHSIHTF